MRSSRSGRVRWPLLVTAIAIVAAALVVFYRQPSSRDASRDLDAGAVAVTAPPGASELQMPAARDHVRLAAVNETRTAPDVRPIEAASDLGVPATRPAFGKFRVVGRVIDENHPPFQSTGAIVRFYGQSDTSDEDVVLGTANVSPSGHFWSDLPRSRMNAAVGKSSYWINARLVAPGYQASEDGADLSEAVDGVLSITLITYRGGRPVFGRVIDGAGRLVAGAKVMYVHWGPPSEMMTVGESETESDGRFNLQVETSGWVDLLITHPSFGVAKVGGKLGPEDSFFDFGDIVIEERGVVAGTVRGRGGRLIPSHVVLLVPVVDHEYIEGQETRSDAHGRFRFANLDDVAYYVTTQYEEIETEECPIVRPDTTDLVVKVSRPTATVTLVDQNGAPIASEDFACRFVPDPAKADAAGQGSRWVDVNGTLPGVYQLVFERSGRFAVGVYLSTDTGRRSATRVLNIGKGHVDIELRLQPDEGSDVRFVVHGTDGRPAPAWRGVIKDPRTGLRVGSLSHKSDPRPVIAGVWSFSVKPRPPSTFLPFTATFEVHEEPPDQPLVVHVHAQQDGGHVRLSVRCADGKTRNVFVDIVDEEGRAFARNTSWKADGALRDIKATLPVGRYTLTLHASNAVPFLGTIPMLSTQFGTTPKPAATGNAKREVKRAFSIRAGEVVVLDLTYP